MDEDDRLLAEALEAEELHISMDKRDNGIDAFPKASACDDTVET